MSIEPSTIQYEECSTSARNAADQLLHYYHNGNLKDTHGRSVDPTDTVKKYILLSVGGTALSQPNESGRLDSGVPLEKAFEYMNFREGPEQVLLCELFNHDSSHFEVSQWKIIAETITRIRNETGNTLDGYMLLHGTDTLALGAKYIPYMLGKGFNRPLTFLGTQHPILSGRQEPRNKIENAIHATIAASREDVGDFFMISHDTLFSALQGMKVNAIGDKIFKPYDERIEVDFAANSDHHAWTFPTARRQDPSVPFEPFTDFVGSNANVVDLDTMFLGEATTRRILQATTGALIRLYPSSTLHPGRADQLREFFDNHKPLILGAPFLNAARAVGSYEAGHQLADIPHLNGAPLALIAKMHYAISRVQHDQEGAENGQKALVHRPQYGWRFADPSVHESFNRIMRANYLGELVENIGTHTAHGN